jgi:hypothetical protein
MPNQFGFIAAPDSHERLRQWPASFKDSYGSMFAVGVAPGCSR